MLKSYVTNCQRVNPIQSHRNPIEIPVKSHEIPLKKPLNPFNERRVKHVPNQPIIRSHPFTSDLTLEKKTSAGLLLPKSTRFSNVPLAS